MTKRKSRAEFKQFSIEVTSNHWKRAKLMCRHDVVTKSVGDKKVASGGVSSNCIIADALVEWLGADAPLTKRTFFDLKKQKYVERQFIAVSVGSETAEIGKNTYRHNGAKLVDGFDSEAKLAAAKSMYGFDLPMKITFTRTK